MSSASYLQMDCRRSRRIIPHCPFMHKMWQITSKATTTASKSTWYFQKVEGKKSSSQDHVHCCWAYMQKRGIRQRRGLCGATYSLHQTQVSETDCSGGLTFISLQIKFDGELVFPTEMLHGGKFGCTSTIFTRIWQLLIVSLQIALYIYKSQY